jgi:RNA polymerase sigma factor (sigma-70 family)
MEAGALPREGKVFAPRSRRLLGAFSDDRLVEHVRRGNDVAFEVLYDRHHRGILSFCRHMLGTREEAEDAVQQTFISAYNDLVASDRSIKLKAWLYTIARNRCLSVLRGRREQAAEAIEVSTAGLADQVQERQELRELLADMRDLPHEQRAALVLAELGDLSHSDIGEILGVDPLKVKSLVFQARSTLIESRDARAIPCVEIREQLSILRGGALRRGPLRKHLKSCEGCRAFRDEVRRQRTALAAVLPVVPTLGLKSNALAAVGGGSGGGAAAAGGLAAGSGGGGIFSAFGTAGLATKAAVTVAVGGAAVGSGVALERTFTPPPSSPPATVEQGTDHRSSVADAQAQGPRGVLESLPGLSAGATANGLARRIRAHGSPATKHHSNTTALEHSKKGKNAAHDHSNNGRHGATSTSSHGTQPSSTREHTHTGWSSATSNSGTGGQRTGQTTPTDDGSSSTTTTTTPTIPVLPDLHGHTDSTQGPRSPSHSADGTTTGTSSSTGVTTTP